MKGEDLNLRDEDDTSQETKSEKTMSQYLIIDPNHICYIVWQSFHTFCCLTSSYFYVILAAFPDALENQFIQNVNAVFEVTFVVTIFLSFFVTYTEVGQVEPVDDLAVVSMSYLTGQFIYDFIPVVPLQSLSLAGYERLFYLIKLMRLYTGFRLINVHHLKEYMERSNKQKLLKIIATDPNHGLTGQRFDKANEGFLMPLFFKAGSG